MTTETQTATQNGSETIVWKLSDLYSGLTDPKLTQDMDEAKKNAQQFVANYKGKLNTLTAQQLKKAYIEIEALLTPLYKLGQYIHLLYAIETQDDLIKNWVDKIDDFCSEISNDILFFELELGLAPTHQLELWQQDDSLSNYKYLLNRTQETAKYNLSEKEEQLSNLKDLTGEDAFQKLYSDLTSSYEYEFELDGKIQKMNGSQLRNLRTHADKDVRRRAMKCFYKKYEEHELVITHSFNNIIKSKAIERKLRGFTSGISAKNIGNDLSDESVQSLHDATKASYPLVQRYYKLKAKLLNLPDISLADIYAPLPNSEKKYTYTEAKELVLTGFKAFDQEIFELANLMFEENRIHAPVLPKKRGGAFCSGSSPDVKPYVMLNFLGKPRDIATMAHELGHAIHDMLCAKQTLLNFHPILPLAETASVFAEMLITDLLLKNETDKSAKINILTDKLEDVFATSHRQNMFSRFEMQVHAHIENDRMSSQELCDLYKKELKLMFGDTVHCPEEYKWEWSSIPHIFESPFYVYAYNFGNLLVMALYQQYLEEGVSFIPKYKTFLSYGSAMSPAEITATVGANINDPEFWKKGFNYIESLLNQLEALVQS